MEKTYFGSAGFLVVSALGGLVSSASTTGSAATLALHGGISAQTAGFAVVITSITSALSNLPVIHQETRSFPLTRTLVFVSGSVVIAGLLVMVLER